MPEAVPARNTDEVAGRKMQWERVCTLEDLGLFRFSAWDCCFLRQALASQNGCFLVPIYGLQYGFMKL